MEQDLSDENIKELCRLYTSCSSERIQQTLDAVQYVIQNDIKGCLIEVGVWKGGMVMAMMYKLKQLDVLRHVLLYDTFSGMSEPSPRDVDLMGVSASNQFEAVKCFASLEEVKANLAKVNYPSEYIHFHVGDIRQITSVPEKIAVLRLDTDWYELVKFELQHFEPSVIPGGVIIIDDYGHWKGCAEGVDEYLAGKGVSLTYADYTGVHWVKKGGKSFSPLGPL